MTDEPHYTAEELEEMKTQYEASQKPAVVPDFDELIRQFVLITQELEAEEENIAHDTETLKAQIGVLRTQLEAELDKHDGKLTILEQRHEAILADLIKSWGPRPKTHELETHIVRRRDSRIVEILSKDKLIEELTVIRKLPEAVAKFDDKVLMGLLEVHVLSSQAAEVKMKTTISCAKKEAPAGESFLNAAPD